MNRFCGAALFIVMALPAMGQIRAADDVKPGADDATAKQPKFELRDGDRVVFLGNTLIERAQRYGYWETMLTARYPDRNITFRNLGWSGDTVWAESRGIFDPPAVGYKRMIEHVGRLKPTVIFLGYGGNEAYAGKDGLPAFIKQYNKLLDDLKGVSAEGMRFVVLSPVRRESSKLVLPDVEKANHRIQEYVTPLREIARQRNSPFVDLFSRVFPSIEMTADGFQYDAGGYFMTKEVVAPSVANQSPEWYLKIFSNGKVGDVKGIKVDDIRVQDSIQFKIQAPFLPVPSFANVLLEHGYRRLVARDLSPGEYELRIDGKAVSTYAGKSFAASASARSWAFGRRIMQGPEYDQVERLRQTIIEKNRLYFYRWRPQNITYLFGFRKHEQGQNAKELAEFDKLIAAKEKEINKLKKPVTHTYEIIRVKKDKKK